MFMFFWGGVFQLLFIHMHLILHTVLEHDALGAESIRVLFQPDK